MALQTIEETMKNEDPALFAIFKKWITWSHQHLSFFTNNMMKLRNQKYLQ
jgi:hypothetical protein